MIKLRANTKLIKYSVKQYALYCLLSRKSFAV